MGKSDFEKLLRQASTFLYKPHIHLYGGEPLDHPELPTLLKLCKHYKFYPTFTTNGIRLLDFVPAIQSSGVRQINLSIGIVRDPNDFPQNLLEAIQTLQNRVIFNLNYLITPDNVNMLEKTVKNCKAIFNKKQIATFICQHRMFEKNECAEVKHTNVESLKKQLLNLKTQKWPFKLLSLPNIFIHDLEGFYYNWNYPFRNKCYIPWLGLSIYPDLSVSPVGGIFRCTEIIGNLHNQTLQGIWRSNKLSAFRQEIRSKLSEQCRKCCHHQYY